MMRINKIENSDAFYDHQEHKLFILLQCFPNIVENREEEIPCTNKQQTKELIEFLIRAVSQLKDYKVSDLELREVLFQEGQSCKERVICMDEYPAILEQMWPCNTCNGDDNEDGRAAKSGVDRLFERLNNHEADEKTSFYKFVLRPVSNTIQRSLTNRRSILTPLSGYKANDRYLSKLLSFRKDKDHQDLCNLPELNESTLLKNLKRRFEHNQIYTYIGSILISINPFHYFPIYNPKFVQSYQGRQLHELPPHIFAIADAAYQNMMSSKLNQCIVISGESGSGKTENANFLLHHLSALSQRGFYSNGIERSIAGVGPVLEAFGNAKTIHNDNSSRFGKFVQVSYKEDGTVHGAVVEKYLLEMSRIVSQPANERNYHVFYYLLAGATASQKKSLQLSSPDHFYYLNQQGHREPQRLMDREVKEFDRLRSAMYSVGFHNEVQERLCIVLAAILHLGNIQFKKRTDSNQHEEHVTVKSMEDVTRVCNLIKVSESSLLEAFTKRKTMAGGEVVVMSNKLEEVVCTCNTTAKCLYSALFNWIVLQINTILLSRHDGKKHQGKCIGVLDIFGFEDFQTNSFEQFCINYANENLHFYFNQHIFKLEQEEYLKEGILWRNIEYIDNTACLDLFNKKPSGLLHLLDEESNFPGATNDTLLSKFHNSHRGKSCYQVPQLRESAFIIVHYAGKVKYQIQEFREKNIDLMRTDVMMMLKNSKLLFIRELIGQNPVAILRWSLLRLMLRVCWAFKRAGLRHRSMEVSVAYPGKYQQGLLRYHKRPLDNFRKNRLYKPRMNLVKHLQEMRSVQGEGQVTIKLPLSIKTSKSKNKPPSTSAQFHNSLLQLTETLNQATPFFIRCIKSNVDKIAKRFNEQFVQRQLRYTGMLATVKIRQSGYNYRSLFADFISYYHLVLPDGKLSSKESIENFLNSLQIDQNNFQIGKTKVFLRENEKLYLDEILHEALMARVLVLQRWMRARITRSTFLKIKQSAIVIQAFLRAYLAQRDFSRLRGACLTIQCWFRMAVMRRHFLAFSSSVPLLLRSSRAFIANRRFCSEKLMAEASNKVMEDDDDDDEDDGDDDDDVCMRPRKADGTRMREQQAALVHKSPLTINPALHTRLSRADRDGGAEGGEDGGEGDGDYGDEGEDVCDGGFMHNTFNKMNEEMIRKEVDDDARNDIFNMPHNPAYLANLNDHRTDESIKMNDYKGDKRKHEDDDDEDDEGYSVMRAEGNSLKTSHHARFEKNDEEKADGHLEDQENSPINDNQVLTTSLVINTNHHTSPKHAHNTEIINDNTHNTEISNDNTNNSQKPTNDSNFSNARLLNESALLDVDEVDDRLISLAGGVNTADLSLANSTSLPEAKRGLPRATLHTSTMLISQDSPFKAVLIDSSQINNRDVPSNNRDVPSNKCDNLSNKYDNTSTKYDNTSTKYEHSPNKYDNSSTKYDNTSNKYDNSSTKYDNTSNKYDNSTTKYDNSPNKYDNSPNKYDNSSNKYDYSPNKYDNSSNKYEHSANKYDNSSNKYDNSSNKYDNSSNKYNNSSNSLSIYANTSNKYSNSSNKHDISTDTNDIPSRKDDLSTDKDDISSYKDGDSFKKEELSLKNRGSPFKVEFQLKESIENVINNLDHGSKIVHFHGSDPLLRSTNEASLTIQIPIRIEGGRMDSKRLDPTKVSQEINMTPQFDHIFEHHTILNESPKKDGGDGNDPLNNDATATSFDVSVSNRKNSSVSSQAGPEDLELKVVPVVESVEMEDDGGMVERVWSEGFKEKNLRAPLAVQESFNDLLVTEEPFTSLDYEVRLLSIDEDEEGNVGNTSYDENIFNDQNGDDSRDNLNHNQRKSYAVKDQKFFNSQIFDDTKGVYHKSALGSKKRKLKNMKNSDLMSSKDSSDKLLDYFTGRDEKDDSKQGMFKINKSKQAHRKQSVKKNHPQAPPTDPDHPSWTVSSTTQWKYPLDLLVENIMQLQQLEHYLSQKVIYLDKLKKERGNKDSDIDEVFKATLHEFHANIVTQVSTAKKATETEYVYSYERLMKLAEEILKAKCRHHKSVFDITVLINPFRGFLDEFMKKKENKELPEMKVKKRHRKSKKTELTFDHMDHQFLLIQFNIATFCEFCSSKLWVLEKGYTCKLCKFTIHKKCASKLATKCPGVTDDVALAARLGHSVIGCPLNVLMQSAPQGYKIHPMIERMINSIEMGGLYTEGLYRKNGKGSDIKQLIAEINSGRGPIEFSDWSIHVLTSVLKTFFRDMPEPLMSFPLYQDYLRTTDIENRRERSEVVCSLVDKLPEVNRHFLERLIFHLTKIALQGNSNLMTAENLSTIFSPGILRNPQCLPMQESLLHIPRQTSCIQFLIEMQMDKTRSTLRHIEIINQDTMEVSSQLQGLQSLSEVGAARRPISVQELKREETEGTEDQPDEAYQVRTLTSHYRSLQKKKQELTEDMVRLSYAKRSYCDVRLSSEEVDSLMGDPDDDVDSLATYNSDDTFLSNQQSSNTTPSSPSYFSPNRNNQKLPTFTYK